MSAPDFKNSIAGSTMFRLWAVAFFVMLLMPLVSLAEDMAGASVQVIETPATIVDKGGQVIVRVGKGDRLLVLRETEKAYVVEIPAQTGKSGYISKKLVEEVVVTEVEETVVDQKDERTWWNRNWKWAAPVGAAVVVGGVALAAGGGGGGGSDDDGSGDGVVGNWVSHDFGVDTYKFASNGTVTGTNHKGQYGQGTYTLSGNSINFFMNFAAAGTHGAGRCNFSGTVNGRTMNLRWDDVGGDSGPTTLTKQ